MAHRSQCSSAGDNPLDPNYLPPHYREEYRLAIDALIEKDLEGYYSFLQSANVVDFLSRQEVEYIQHTTQTPHQSTQPELQFPDSGGEGSSDTYWPMHSDLDAPGLDLGWPQHRFIGPTEVTVLVNPSEPDMPSIKEQARRLIRNAQQVVAVVMDMFTDVDIFADILDATRRNVAVYILLDEHNVHHFIDMVSNCRVNLENNPLMRVRTVSGLTYYCRTGKSFKGQMMNRFLLTDCRAVLSGNYSFMWSFEKIHRCIAQLFLGQLVTTFDEEFRILFAQSQPLIFENPNIDRLSTDRTQLFRDPRKIMPIESSCPKEWAGHSFDERMYVDQQQLIQRLPDQGQLQMYNPSQQLRVDPSLMEQGYPMIPPNRMGPSAFQRHSFAEGAHGRLSSYQFMQPQTMQSFETQGRQMHRDQPREHHPYHHRAGPETSYAGYDKFKGYGCPPMHQYSEAEYQQEMEPDVYDPVVNYMSSTSAVEMDDGSDKVASGDIPFAPSHPKRTSIGQPYACQRSPALKNSPEQSEFFQGPSKDRKTPDLSAKQGMRDWRISSYLSAFDDAGDEEMSMQPPFETEPFDEPPNPVQVKSSGLVLPDSMISAKEFRKFQTAPRVSHLQSYSKLVIPEHQSSQTKGSNIMDTMTPEPKATPTPSESSSTIEDDKSKDVEVKEPKERCLKRDDSFIKRQSAAIQRSSRLRSSLIFSSQLEQHFSQEMQSTPGQQEEETGKNEDDQSILHSSSPILTKRRSFTREPFEWSRYKKTVDSNSTINDSLKSDEAGVVDLPCVLLVNKDIKEQPRPMEAELTEVLPVVHPPKPCQDEQQKNAKTEQNTEQPTFQTKPLLINAPYVDMNDPDTRLMFFKELAAQRKAAKAAASENSNKKAPVKPDFSMNPGNQQTETPSQSLEPKLLKGPHKTTGDSTNMSALPTETTRTSVTTPFSPEIKSRMPTVTCGKSHLNVKEASNLAEQDPKNSQPTNMDNVSSNEGALPGSTDAEKIELKRSQNVSGKIEEHPATSNIVSEDLSSLVGSSTDVKECSSPKCDNTSSSANLVSSVSTPSHYQSTQMLKPTNVATKEVCSTHPPTPCDTQSSLQQTPISTQTDQSSSSNSNTLIPTTQLCSPTLSATSTTPQSIPLETNTTPQTVPLAPGTITPSTPLPPSLFPNPDDSVLPFKPKETKPNESQSFTPLKSPSKINQGESSFPKHSPEELVLSPMLPHTKSISFSQPTSSPLQPVLPATSSTPNPIPSATICSSQPVSSATNSTPQPVPSETSSTSIPILSVTSSAPHPGPLESSTSSGPSTPLISLQSSLSSCPDVAISPMDKTNEKSINSNPNSTATKLCSSPTPGPDQSVQLSKPNITEPTTSFSNSQEPSSVKPSSPAPISESGFPAKATESQKQRIFQSEPTHIESISPTLKNISFSTATELYSSPVSTSDGVTVESSESDKTQFVSSPKLSPTSDKASSLPEPTSSELKESPAPTPHTESCSSSMHALSKSTSSVNPVLIESNPSPDSSSVENTTLEPSVFVENCSKETQSELSRPESKPERSVTPPEELVIHGSQSDEANTTLSTSESASDQDIPISPQSKSSKGSQSRYHSSTAKVLSSSNLRDDTKLLLGQISANSQNRAELAKESAVTDDAKEDEAHRVENVGGGNLERSQSKKRVRTPQEREDLLNKIQSMRKEKKVYSRFEMAP